MSKCVLYDRECIDCGECDRCDLDPDKICDNCMKCVNNGAEYRAVVIDEVINDGAKKKPHDSHDGCSCGHHCH